MLEMQKDVKTIDCEVNAILDNITELLKLILRDCDTENSV